MILNALVCLAIAGGARAVQPEFLACLGGHGDEALAAAQIGQTHDLRSGSTAASSHRPPHRRPATIFGRAPRLDLVAYPTALRLALIEMFQPRNKRRDAHPI